MSLCRVIASFLLASLLAGQSASDPVTVPLHVDSRRLDNETATSRVVFGYTLLPPFDAAIVQIHVSSADLHGGSRIRISQLDSLASVELDATELEAWHGRSPLFQGGPIAIELIAAPGSRGNRVVLSGYEYSRAHGGTDDLCGSDDRLPSSIPWVCRLFHNTTFIGSAFMFGTLSNGLPTGSAVAVCSCHQVNRNATFDRRNLVVEFNVAPSDPSTGAWIVTPGNQYPSAETSLLLATNCPTWTCNSGFGQFAWQDSYSFRLSNAHGGPAHGRFGTCYSYPFDLRFLDGKPVMVPGYGSSSVPTLNWTQQSDLGPFRYLDPFGYFASSDPCYGPPAILQYAVDTTPQHSGGPVVEAGNQWVVGVHAADGCNHPQQNNNNGVTLYWNTASPPLPPLRVTPATSTAGTSSGSATASGGNDQLVGGSAEQEVNGLPVRPGDSPVATFLARGFRNNAWAGGSLPVSLGALGMPGSTLYVDPASIRFVVPRFAGNTRGTYSTSIPASSQLVGLTLYSQWLYENPSSAEGWSVTNYVAQRIGGYAGVY